MAKQIYSIGAIEAYQPLKNLPAHYRSSCHKSAGHGADHVPRYVVVGAVAAGCLPTVGVYGDYIAFYMQRSPQPVLSGVAN